MSDTSFFVRINVLSTDNIIVETQTKSFHEMTIADLAKVVDSTLIFANDFRIIWSGKQIFPRWENCSHQFYPETFLRDFHLANDINIWVVVVSMKNPNHHN